MLKFVHASNNRLVKRLHYKSAVEVSGIYFLSFLLKNQAEKEEKDLKAEVSITNQAEHGRSPFEDETAEEVGSVLKRELKSNSPQAVPRAPPDEKPPLSFR